MLERAGFTTGYDLPALISTAGWICGLLGKTPTAAVTRAGLVPLPA
jgi:hydroxymethylglutaryl-CoA lyase